MLLTIQLKTKSQSIFIYLLLLLFCLKRKSVLNKSLNLTCLIHFHPNKNHFYQIWKHLSDKITNASAALPKPAPCTASQRRRTHISWIHKTKQNSQLSRSAPPSTSRSSILRLKQLIKSKKKRNKIPSLQNVNFVRWEIR